MNRERRITSFAAVAAACCVLGGAAAIWGFVADRAAFFTAWLASFYFWVGIPVGSLALLLIHDLTGGQWQRTARTPLEAAVTTLPLFILFFLPVAAGLSELYAWARPDEAATLANRWYLNPEFFIARAAAYFLVWIIFAALKLRRPGTTPPFLAGIGVILIGLSVAYAAIDWIMSTEPRWFSTIYSMIAGASQFLVALSLVLLAIAVTGPRDGIDQKSYRDDLANLATLLLAVVIFWAYASFCQFLIIWEENLSDEIGWYIERSAGAWQGVIYALAVTEFLVPFVALVTIPAKRSRRVVGGTCLLLLAANLLQIWWLALPPFGARGFTWLAPAIAIFMGGAVSFVFLLTLRCRSAPMLGAVTAAERLRHG
jgi:xanthosine utilization system XapX-like protein